MAIVSRELSADYNAQLSTSPILGFSLHIKAIRTIVRQCNIVLRTSILCYEHILE